jgi:hypothetical protein
MQLQHNAAQPDVSGWGVARSAESCIPGQLKLIMRVGPLADAMKPDFQGVRTHWNQGFMTFRNDRRTLIVMPMIPVRLESHFA